MDGERFTSATHRSIAGSNARIEPDRLADAYVRHVRTIPPALFVVVALVAIIVTGDDQLVPALVVSAVSAFVFGPIFILIARGGRQRLAASLAVPADALLAAALIASIDGPGRFAFGMLWPVVVGCFVLSSRMTAVTLVLSTVASVGILLSDGAVNDVQYVTTPTFILLIGGALVALSYWQRLGGRELQRSQVQLEMAQRLSRSGSWEWIPSTDDSYWSPELYRIFGLPDGVEMGLDVFMSSIVPSDHERVGAAVERGVADGTGYRFDATITRGDGARRVIEVIGTVARVDPDTGEALHLFGSVQDVTELRDVDQLRSEFIATASHELRTPAAVIVGFSTTLHTMWDSFDEPQRREFIGHLHDAGGRLTRLIEDLLQASRIETGRLHVDVEEVDVTAIVEESLRHRGAQGIGHSRLDPERGALIACADASRLRQVIDNLVDNARIHTPDGTTVRVELSREDEHVRIDVVDDGDGIDEHDAQRVFDRFVRLSIDDAAGTGLGLYISRKLAESQNGSLELAAQRRGEGARFVIRIPAPRS